MRQVGNGSGKTVKPKQKDLSLNLRFATKPVALGICFKLSGPHFPHLGQWHLLFLGYGDYLATYKKILRIILIFLYLVL